MRNFVFIFLLLFTASCSEPKQNKKVSNFTADQSIELDAYRNLKTRINDFQVNDNGTVVDKKTGLTWMRCSLGQESNTDCSGNTNDMYWDDAMNVIADFEFAGHSDWRLPTRWELQTLVHCHSGKQKARNIDTESLGRCDKQEPKAAIIEKVFPNTVAHWYWTSSEKTDKPDYKYFVSFQTGTDESYYKNYANSIRLVRSN